MSRHCRTDLKNSLSESDRVIVPFSECLLIIRNVTEAGFSDDVIKSGGYLIYIGDTGLVTVLTRK